MVRVCLSSLFQAARLAVEQGWAINIGGGFHHCSADRGGGFCAYADITLAVKFAMEHYDKVTNVMIIDLDAHQVRIVLCCFFMCKGECWPIQSRRN